MVYFFAVVKSIGVQLSTNNSLTYCFLPILSIKRHLFAFILHVERRLFLQLSLKEYCDQWLSNRKYHDEHPVWTKDHWYYGWVDGSWQEHYMEWCYNRDNLELPF